MTYYQQDQQQDNHFNKLPPLSFYQKKEKQTLEYILDDNKRQQFIPYESRQRLPSPVSSDEEELKQQPRTANEIQYMKRIQALMVLVARQTKEIQSLREIIARSDDDNDDTCILHSKKRNKQS